MTIPSRVIIWGHKLHSHTHSYIHYGFQRGFEALGFESLWLDNNSDISGLDLANTLFITEGQVDDKMPKRKDCFYLLHNTNPCKYVGEVDENRTLALQTFTNSRRLQPSSQIEPCIYLESRCFYMPWATDLLPHEINQIEDQNYTPEARNSRYIHWCGTVGGGKFGNSEQLTPFITEASRDGLIFKHSDPWATPKSFHDNRILIQQSHLAPTIVGAWQRENDYIPCRLFKNISYGKLGVTNCLAGYHLLEGLAIFEDDTAKLYRDAKTFLDTKPDEVRRMTKEAMKLVASKHTYINRCQTILKAFE